MYNRNVNNEIYHKVSSMVCNLYSSMYNRNVINEIYHKVLSMVIVHTKYTFFYTMNM